MVAFPLDSGQAARALVVRNPQPSLVGHAQREVLHVGHVVPPRGRVAGVVHLPQEVEVYDAVAVVHLGVERLHVVLAALHVRAIADLDASPLHDDHCGADLLLHPRQTLLQPHERALAHGLALLVTGLHEVLVAHATVPLDEVEHQAQVSNVQLRRVAEVAALRLVLQHGLELADVDGAVLVHVNAAHDLPHPLVLLPRRVGLLGLLLRAPAGLRHGDHVLAYNGSEDG
mmetsp:Transcript_132362/g.411453  ORF Transcript_132362/g.411453 Transcript_132362/m.411453 type:complete len:229 (+) Transcript_132362:196-882(+)